MLMLFFMHLTLNTADRVDEVLSSFRAAYGIPRRTASRRLQIAPADFFRWLRQARAAWAARARPRRSAGNRRQG
jgi:hypothetical protein